MFLPWKTWLTLNIPLKLFIIKCPRRSLAVTCRHSLTLRAPRQAIKGCVLVFLVLSRSIGALTLKKF